MHEKHNMSFEVQKKAIRKRIDKIDTMLKDAFETGLSSHSEGLQKSIQEWEVERRALILEEQEMIKATKTFFEQSNLLLDFCKDCHSAFLKGTAEQI